MNEKKLKQVFMSVKKGTLSVNQALEATLNQGFENLGFAKVDHNRAERCGFPEVIFCPGKTPRQITDIARAIYKRDGKLLATRADRKIFNSVKKALPKAVFNEAGRTITALKKKADPVGTIHIVTGGTSDIPVAEEAAETANIMGCGVEKLYDAGVAGIHRLLNNVDLFKNAEAIIVVAGMEGALPSVVGGLVKCPVIAVPTSIGYGAHFNGLAALLAMLNSCASNVVVTNIDNGFRAGYVASLIVNRKM